MLWRESCFSCCTLQKHHSCTIEYHVATAIWMRDAAYYESSRDAARDVVPGPSMKQLLCNIVGLLDCLQALSTLSLHQQDASCSCHLGRRIGLQSWNCLDEFTRVVHGSGVGAIGVLGEYGIQGIQKCCHVWMQSNALQLACQTFIPTHVCKNKSSICIVSNQVSHGPYPSFDPLRRDETQYCKTKCCAKYKHEIQHMQCNMAGNGSLWIRKDEGRPSSLQLLTNITMSCNIQEAPALVMPL